MAAVAAISLGFGLQAQESPAGGCCRELRSVYEASLFQIDAMRLLVRVDAATGEAVEALIRSATRTSGLEEMVARRYREASEATIDMEFLVGVSGGTFIANTVKAIRELGGDGSVTAAQADSAARETAERFAFLEATRVQEGDRLRYHLQGDTLTTTFWREGAILGTSREVGARIVRVVLATYFAPSSNFRKGLLDSAFRRP